MLHSASRVVLLFWIASAAEFKDLCSVSGDIYAILQGCVQAIAPKRIADALPPHLRDRETAPCFTVTCRPSGRGVEKVAFHKAVILPQVEAAIRRGIQSVTGWSSSPGTYDVEVVAFLGTDHLALGVEVPPKATAALAGMRFAWGRVPYIGMETQLAGAMAWLAAEGVSSRAGVAGLVADPACGTGTLLLAAARLWPTAQAPGLVGRDLDPKAISTCVANLVALGLDSSDVRVGDGRHLAHLADGAASAVLCDLPCGRRHKEGAEPETYDAILQEAARVLRPGGRCVLLSTRREMLATALGQGPWRPVAAWAVGRGHGGLRESQLLAVERLGGTAGQPEAEAAELQLQPPGRSEGRATRGSASEAIRAEWQSRGL